MKNLKNNRPRPQKPLLLLEHIENHPEYVKANLELILQTVPEQCGGVNATFIKRIGINNTLLSSSKGKLCMIDQYGRTAWLLPEETRQTSVPFLVGMGSNGKFIRRIEPSSMRQAYGGEELTMNFIRALYGVFDVSKMEEDASGKKVYRGNLIDNPEPSRIENIPAMFQGDFSEFYNAVNAVKDNWVKVAIGVGSTDNGFVHVIYDYFMRPFEGANNVKYKITNETRDDIVSANWDFETIHVFDSNKFTPQNITQNVPQPVSQQPVLEQNEDLPF